jgi:hypothetical protein
LIGADLGPLDELLNVVPSERTVRVEHPLLRGGSEPLQRIRRDLDSLFGPSLGTLHVGLSGVPDPLQFCDSTLQVGIRQIGETILDRLVQPGQLVLGVLGVPLQRNDTPGFRDPRRPTTLAESEVPMS